MSLIHAGDGTATSWWPAGRLRSLVCSLRGHRWTSQPTASGSVLVFCSGCSELVTVGFVDVDDVMGLPARGGSSWLGVASAARLAVDLAAALVEQDDTAWRRIRREATGRPGDAVDGLSQLAAVLSRMVDEARPLRALHEVAARVEVSAIEQELLELGRRATS